MQSPVPLARRVAGALVGALLLASSADAGEMPTAADVTEPGRSLARALDMVVGGRPADRDRDRTVAIVLDPSPALATAGFADALDAAIDRQAAHLAKTRLGLVVAGARGAWAVAPTSDHAEVVSAVREALARPAPTWPRLHADLRKIAGRLGSGSREVLLATLANGDLEDDLEGTARLLASKNVRTHVLSSEAYLSDTYVLSRGATAKPPSGLSVPGGGDGAFVQVPWGWLLQVGGGHEDAPAGFAPYACSRLAAATGGRVFLYAPAAGAHRCTITGSCIFCSGDHRPADMGYQAHRLRALAPRVGPRKDVLAAAAKDPHVRAVIDAWGKAAKAGLIRSRPAYKRAGGTLKPERTRPVRTAQVYGSRSLDRHAKAAEKALAACEAIEKDLAATLARLADKDGVPRYRAMAEHTLSMVRLTALNMRLCMGYCGDAGRVLLDTNGLEVAPPEMSPYSADSARIVGMSVTGMGLCHGLAPFAHVRLPGGAAVRTHILALEKELAPLRARFAHTPFGVALRRAQVARFTPTWRGTGTVPESQRDGSTTDKPTTATPRPGRSSGPGVAPGSSGPTTGG